jgi:tRNA threonylcarbamoyladenosine biosynthesis protein TsaB
MKILALELSTARGSLAWLNNDVDLVVREWANDRKNSGMFFENLQEISQTLGSPDKIVVGLGPGSYAGTRIAIATAIGLQTASKARLLGLPSICAIENAGYCVIGDARQQSFFFARIRKQELVEGPSLFSDEELKSKLEILDDSMPLFCSESLPQFPKAVIRYPSAELLARLARDSGRSFKLPLEPIYLREPHITLPKAQRIAS